jgi:hypothetical protein
MDDWGDWASIPGRGKIFFFFAVITDVMLVELIFRLVLF